MATRRMFVAIALPGPVRDALAALTAPVPGVNWTPTEQLHLTLRFLGDVSVEQREAIIKHLATVRVEPFILPVEGVGAFPPTASPRVVWVGVGRGHPRLHQLRQRVDDALLAAGLLDLDVHVFHPHVTLGRCREDAPAEARHWIRTHREFVAPPFRVEAFSLMESRLLPARAVHTAVQRFALAK